MSEQSGLGVYRRLQPIDEMGEMGVAVRLAAGSDGRHIDQIVWLEDDKPWVTHPLDGLAVDNVDLTPLLYEWDEVSMVATIGAVCRYAALFAGACVSIEDVVLNAFDADALVYHAISITNPS